MNYHRYQFPATGTLHRSDDDAVDLYITGLIAPAAVDDKVCNSTQVDEHKTEDAAEKAYAHKIRKCCSC